MKTFLKSLVILVVTMCGAFGCSNNESTKNDSFTAAYKRGQSDAKALSQANYEAEKDLHAALLAVKAREWQLRERGDAVSAEAYINGFRQYLKEHDVSLADKIF